MRSRYGFALLYFCSPGAGRGKIPHSPQASTHLAIPTHPTPPHAQSFLEANLSKGKKSTKSPLGVIEPTLATAIQENLDIPCRSDETIRELVRGIRTHFTKFVKPLDQGGLEQAQLGLGHAYSRSKVCPPSLALCSRLASPRLASPSR